MDVYNIQDFILNLSKEDIDFCINEFKVSIEDYCILDENRINLNIVLVDVFFNRDIDILINVDKDILIINSKICFNSRLDNDFIRNDLLKVINKYNISENMKIYVEFHNRRGQYEQDGFSIKIENIYAFLENEEELIEYFIIEFLSEINDIYISMESIGNDFGTKVG